MQASNDEPTYRPSTTRRIKVRNTVTFVDEWKGRFQFAPQFATSITANGWRIVDLGFHLLTVGREQDFNIRIKLRKVV